MRLVNRVGLNYAIDKYNYQPETKTLLVALTGTYSAARKKEIDKLIKSLKTSGVWAKLDVFQMYAALNRADSVVNWKNPGTFNAILVNSPTFTANKGILSGNGICVNSQYNPYLGGVNYTQDNVSIGTYIQELFTDVGMISAGANDATQYTRIIPSRNDFWRLNEDTTENISHTLTLQAGLNAMSRTNSTQIIVNINSQTQTLSRLSRGIPNQNIYVAANNNNGTMNNYSDKIVSLFFAGANISSEWTAFLTTVETYLDYIGAGVI
jgi:hypothetical protein